MKILNLYAGIGGNRKLWTDVEVTAVELNPQIAKIYQDFFPNDKVIVADAHQYLLEHFGEFDFIWASPPCPTHSRINKANHLSPYKDNSAQLENGGAIPARYPDMTLYQEIIFLKHFCKAKWCVENVIAYYEPLIPPQEIQRHYFWANFHIADIFEKKKEHFVRQEDLTKCKGFDISKYSLTERKDQILRNCVNPNVGLHILNESKRDIHPELFRIDRG
jgi:DNA (cytosine-5)-methyltransferase 1